MEIWKCVDISSGLILDWKLNPNTSCLCVSSNIFTQVYVRKQWLTFDLVMDFGKIQNFRWKYGNVSISQVDLFWTGNYIPILPVYVFLRTYLLKLCHESMIDI